MACNMMLSVVTAGLKCLGETLCTDYNLKTSTFAYDAPGTFSVGTVTFGIVTIGTLTPGTVTLGTVTPGTGTLGTVTFGIVTSGTVTFGEVTFGTEPGIFEEGTGAEGTIMGVVIGVVMEFARVGSLRPASVRSLSAVPWI